MRAPVVVFSYIQQSSMMFVNMVVPKDNSPYMGTSGASSREESGMLNWFKVSHLPSILQTKEIQVHVLTYLVIIGNPITPTFELKGKEKSLLISCLSHAEIEAL